MNIIVMAIPLFLFLIVIELIVDRYRGTGYYRFNDFISSLNLGIFSRITGILKSLTAFSIYYYCYQHFSLWQLEASLAVWLFAFVAYDLAYYWSHRLNHRIAVMWGSHVVHHSGEEYNLTTALRQTGTFSLFGWALYLPLAIVGVSPTMALACGALNLIYQFWVHTRHINKMPKWFEAIFVTPSHHRVHHALNRDYIDKNYAGVFILWDKWFNSFQAEKDNVDIVYGVSHQLKSWNPLWANVQVYSHLFIDALRTKNWADKIRVWFKPPGWRPDDVNTKYPRPWATTKNLVKYDVDISLNAKRYLAVHFLIFLALIVLFLVWSPSLSASSNTLLCGVAILNLLGFSAIQEKKSWAMATEAFRLFTTSSALILMSPESEQNVVMLNTLVFSVVSMLVFYLFIAKQNKQQYQATLDVTR